MDQSNDAVKVLNSNSVPKPITISPNPAKELFREKMTLPKNELILSQISKPWTIIKRIVGLVIVTYLLSNSILMIFFLILTD